MGMAMCNALALLRWHGSRFFHGNFGDNDFVWLLIGLVLVVVVIWALRRRRRRWL
jgi:LPXTG-motif cell wall-anchored protein